MWLLDVKKAFGLVHAMIPNVSSDWVHVLNESTWSAKLDPFFLAMRHVLHLKMVTQCAMLERFGIFLVLADQVRDSLFK